MASEYKYGSVSNDAEVGATGGDTSFDETNLYYMKEEERTRKEKLMAAIKLGVPIFIAAIFVIGIGYLLFSNFGYFYPGRGGQVSPSKHSSGSGSTYTTSSSPTEPTSTHYENISSALSSGGSCAANPKCADLGLTGECCPTSEGIKLGCCA